MRHPLVSADHTIQRAVTGVVSTVSSMLGMGDPVAKYDKNLPVGTGYVPEEHHDGFPLVPRSRFAVRPIYQGETDINPDTPEEKVREMRMRVSGRHHDNLAAYLNSGLKLPCKWPLEAVDHRRVMDINLVFTRTTPVSQFSQASGNKALVIQIDKRFLQSQLRDFLVMEKDAYHFVPHCITVTDVQNQLPIPLAANVFSKIPGSSESRGWFASNYVCNTIGSGGSMVLAANHTCTMNKVVFVGDESVLCTTSFCRWACVDYDTQLSGMTKDDSGRWYIISIPESFTIAPSTLVHEIMRMWPRIQQESLLAIQEGKAGQLRPDQLITSNAAGGYNLNIPVCVLDEHMRIHESRTSQKIHLMQLDDVRLVVVPANQFGWDMLPRSESAHASPSSPMARLADPLVTLTVTVKLTGTVVPRGVQM